MSVSGQQSVILCIDDEQAALRVRQLVLEYAGYRVLTATNGAAGLELFREQHVDLVITDHLLPGQTGSQVAREMKRLKPEVPVAMLSGLAERPEGGEAPDAFLTKGGPVPEFLASVGSLLRGSQRQSDRR
jgi:DNA-binding response OmpR family regulator